MAEAIFEKACPNCNGKISSLRLLKGLPCEICLPQANSLSFEKLLEKLKERNELKGLKKIYEFKKREEEFSAFFRERVGNEPWALQRAWFRRMLAKRSFAIVAPPGVGKTDLWNNNLPFLRGEILPHLPNAPFGRTGKQSLKQIQ